MLDQEVPRKHLYGSGRAASLRSRTGLAWDPFLCDLDLEGHPGEIGFRLALLST